MEEKRGVSFIMKKIMVELNQREIEELLQALRLGQENGFNSYDTFKLYDKLIMKQWALIHEKYNKSGIETY